MNSLLEILAFYYLPSEKISLSQSDLNLVGKYVNSLFCDKHNLFQNYVQNLSRLQIYSFSCSFLSSNVTCIKV